MKYSFFFIMIFFSSYSFSQTTEKFYDYKWNVCEPGAARFYSTTTKTDSGYVENDYFIHEKKLQMTGKYEDEACKIRNGWFYWFHPNGNINSYGKYVHNKRDGLWISYHTNGMMSDSTLYENGKVTGTSLSWYPNGYMRDSSVVSSNGSMISVGWFDNGNLSSAGRYNNEDKKTGVWQFFHSNGKLSAKEWYDNGKLINKEYYDEKGIAEADTASKDRDADYPGGIKNWTNYLSSNCIFPPQFQIVNADKAVVVVSFSVDEEGKTGNIEITTPFYPDFDRIAVNAIKNSKRWKPAINHNRKVKFYMSQPLVFSQE